MLGYVGIGTMNSTLDASEYFEYRQQLNSRGGSSIEISSMSFPMQLFSYLFRPLIFEANNVFSLLAAIDNLIIGILFLVSIYVFFCCKLKWILIKKNSFLLIYSLSTWIILSMTTANLGIAMRQKWLFLPMLIFVMISFYSDQKLIKRPFKINVKS